MCEKEAAKSDGKCWVWCCGRGRRRVVTGAAESEESKSGSEKANESTELELSMQRRTPRLGLIRGRKYFCGSPFAPALGDGVSERGSPVTFSLAEESSSRSLATPSDIDDKSSETQHVIANNNFIESPTI